MGDKVMMRAKEKWEPAIVIAISQTGPHSYIANTTRGYRQNKRHLKSAPSSLNARQQNPEL